jgi:hypothetical protein
MKAYELEAGAGAKALGMFTITVMAAVTRTWLLGERRAQARFDIAVPLRVCRQSLLKKPGQKGVS